jgi:hypothetical protein
VTEVPDPRDKDERWLTSFTVEAVLARNERNIATAEEEWQRRDRLDVVPRIRKQFGPGPTREEG